MITTIIAFIIIFGILVFVHEFGHFFFARKSGILVREFSIGMGPKLFAVHRNGTTYTIRILPLGGYVRMAGLEDDKDTLKQGMPVSLLVGKDNKVKNINTSKNFFKSKNIFFTIFTFILAIITIFIEKNLSFTTYTNFNNIYLIFSGFLMSIGIVIPGVSSTVILMLLGIYKFYLMAISNIYFPILIPMAIGIILGSIIFIKLINYLFNKYYFQTFYSIIGFSFGSILVLIPELNNFIEYIIFLLCVYLGFLISSSISKT